MNTFDIGQATRAPRVLQVLQDSYRVSKTVWDELPIAMYICDADGCLVQVNRRACEVWGFSPPLNGAPHRFGAVLRLFRHDGHEIPPENLPILEVLANGRRRHDETYILERADGTRVTILANIDPVIDGDGTIVGAVNCFQDVTSLRKPIFDAAPAAGGAFGGLNDNFHLAQRIEAIFDRAGVGIVEVDETGKVLRVNDTMCDITGYTRGELVGTTVYQRTHPDDAARDRLHYRQQVIGGYDRYAIEKRFVRKDGTVIWISVLSSSVRDRQGAFQYGLRVIEDITAQKSGEDRSS